MHYIHLSPKEIYLVLKICTNGYHIETINEDKKLYIYIYKENKYFEYMTLTKANVTTILGSTYMIKGFRRANILLPNNTKRDIKDALYSP